MSEPLLSGQVLYRRLSPTRARRFQIETTILATAAGGKLDTATCGKVVIKRALHAEGIEHLRRMAANQRSLQDARSPVVSCPCRMRGDLLEIEHVAGESLGGQLVAALRADDRAMVKTLLELYRDCITALDPCTGKLIGPGSRDEIFAGNDPDSSDMIASGNIDQGFDHFIHQADRLVLIDHEWILGFPVATHYVLYRAAQLFFQEVPRQISPHFRLQDMCDFYGITRAERSIYDRMESHFQRFVRGETGTKTGTATGTT